MADQLQQDCSNANAVLGDPALQSNPKRKEMESFHPEEDLAEDAKIGNTTRSDKKGNRNIIPSFCNTLNVWGAVCKFIIYFTFGRFFRDMFFYL